MSYSESSVIVSYTVVAQGNPPPDDPAAIARHLYLEADASATGTFKHFAIYFFESPPSLGYVNPDDGFVVPYLPLRDFADIYHIVQTERPVYTSFFADDSKQLGWFQVRTGLEPTGEGPVDFS